MDLEGVMLSENKSDLVTKSWTGLERLTLSQKGKYYITYIWNLKSIAN